MRRQHASGSKSEEKKKQSSKRSICSPILKGRVRKLGAKALGKSLGQNVHLFSLITNTLAKDKETEDRWRGYASPSAARNLSNRVEDEVVDALVVAVKRSPLFVPQILQA